MNNLLKIFPHTIVLIVKIIKYLHKVTFINYEAENCFVQEMNFNPDRKQTKIWRAVSCEQPHFCYLNFNPDS